MSGATSQTLPFPPPKLARRVFAVPIGSDFNRAYNVLGAQTKQQVVSMLPDDWDFDGRRILDFGCGAGRTLRHFMEEAEVADIWGTDIHEPSIDWINQNLSPSIHGWKSAGLPPLGLEHESFDLIYAVSVFTHLADESLLWLVELHRLLKPGGRLIVTYMGEWVSEWFAKEPWDPDRIGMNVLYKSRSWDLGGPAILMSEWWIREHWGRLFDIKTIEPQFQNFAWVSMTKREANLTTKEIAEPSSDPREFAALRHNIVQLHREVVSELENERELGNQRLHEMKSHNEQLLGTRGQRIDRLLPSSGGRFSALARRLSLKRR